MNGMTLATVIIFLLLILIIVIFINILIIFFAREYVGKKIPAEIKKVCKIDRYIYKRRKVYVIRNKRTKKTNINKVVLYMHGGAFLKNIGNEHWILSKDLVCEQNNIVIIPDYPLLPKNTYKEIYDFCYDLYKELLISLNEPLDKLVLAGDSAGGTIVLGLAYLAKKDKLYVPNKIVTISPWLNIRLDNKKIEEVQKEDKMLSHKLLKIIGETFAGTGDPEMDIISPYYGDVSSFKKIIIYIGTHDILYPDVIDFREILNEKNVDYEIIIKEEGVHIYPLLEDYKKDEDYINFIKNISK